MPANVSRLMLPPQLPWVGAPAADVVDTDLADAGA
jgi:hypothetical protein